MKKILLCFAATLFLLSCKEKSSSSQAEVSLEEPDIVSSPETKEGETVSGDWKVDYDLSAMNSNLVYAEVFNMMIEPEIYDDKVIKMKGNFAVYDSSLVPGGKTYAVIISDALACCQQGIEFHYDFPDGEPQEGDIVTVTGVYVTAMLPGDVVYNYVKASLVEKDA